MQRVLSDAWRCAFVSRGSGGVFMAKDATAHEKCNAGAIKAAIGVL